jgi:hypothetical protein
MSNKGCVSKYFKKPLPTNKKDGQPIEQQVKVYNKYFPIEDIQVAQKIDELFNFISHC